MARICLNVVKILFMLSLFGAIIQLYKIGVYKNYAVYMELQQWLIILAITASSLIIYYAVKPSANSDVF